MGRGGAVYGGQAVFRDERPLPTFRREPHRTTRRRGR
jgi:hypothetical protein